MAWYSGCSYGGFENSLYEPFPLSLCVSEGAGFVSASLELDNFFPAGYDYNENWTMYLERWDGSAGDGWRTISTRTGYVAYNSPSNRTFTNIGELGISIRVRVVMQAGNQTFYSPNWVK